MTTNLRITTLVFILAAATACGAPGERGLRDSFAEQLAANRFVNGFTRNGDELTFSGPGPEGGGAKWRVQIEAAIVEAQDDEKQPYKGTVRSSWFADGLKIEPGGGQSNLPFELTSNGLSQDCWAFWDEAGRRWSWE